MRRGRSAVLLDGKRTLGRQAVSAEPVAIDPERKSSEAARRVAKSNGLADRAPKRNFLESHFSACQKSAARTNRSHRTAGASAAHCLSAGSRADRRGFTQDGWHHLAGINHGSMPDDDDVILVDHDRLTPTELLAPTDRKQRSGCVANTVDLNQRSESLPFTHHRATPRRDLDHRRRFGGRTRLRGFRNQPDCVAKVAKQPL